MNSSENSKNFNKLLEEIKGSDYEVKEIGEISRKIFAGNSSITKTSGEEGKYGAVICTDIFDSDVYINKSKIFVDQEIKVNQPFIEKGDIVIARSGYTRRNKYGCRLFWGDFKALAGNHTYVLKHSQNPKYLISVFSSNPFVEQAKGFFKMGLSSVMTLDSSNFKRIKIPLPSLDLQAQIGDFLFTFVEYDKQLKREQRARRRQFHYFKEQIFSDLVERCGLRDAG